MTKEVVINKAKNGTLIGFEENDCNKKWKGNFTFIQAADTQLGMISNFDKEFGEASQTRYPDKITWEKEIELCKKSVDYANSMNPKPKFFIICGDILDAFPDKFPEVRERQRQDFLKIYSELQDIPLICVCGNHDVGNTPTSETIKNYRDQFGDDYFSFWIGGLHCIVINSQYYHDSSKVPDLAQAQEEWLDKELSTSKERGSKHIVIFQHIPWFVKSPEEEKIYFNIEINVRRKMLSKFYNSGVKIIFTGHYHRNAGGFYKEMELVVTSAIGCQIGDDNHGMRIVTVTENEIKHEYVGISNDIN